MVCEKVPHLTGKYLFSVDPKNISEKSKSYVGKLRSNISGSNFNLYDHGQDPSSFRTSTNPRENLMAVNYVFFKEVIQYRILEFLKRMDLENLV